MGALGRFRESQEIEEGLRGFMSVLDGLREFKGRSRGFHGYSKGSQECFRGSQVFQGVPGDLKNVSEGLRKYHGISGDSRGHRRCILLLEQGGLKAISGVLSGVLRVLREYQERFRRFSESQGF